MVSALFSSLFDETRSEQSKASHADIVSARHRISLLIYPHSLLHSCHQIQYVVLLASFVVSCAVIPPEEGVAERKTYDGTHHLEACL